MGPKAEGWLGGTYGFTDDNTHVGMVRFDSRETAARHSTRPSNPALLCGRYHTIAHQRSWTATATTSEVTWHL